MKERQINTIGLLLVVLGILILLLYYVGNLGYKKPKESIWEPNYAVVFLPTRGNLMFIAAAKTDAPNWKKTLEEAFEKTPEDSTRFPLSLLKGGEGGLFGRIEYACEELRNKGYDPNTALFGFYFERNGE